ncbi:MAG: asparagine synthase (glutamine-hydrolyzing) [Sphingomonas sp.]|uniref:asparagine synthase (glutamine-hydrolyzing) n=1 Tax=Sphingomonas sp. TaxID=28214 RepID=UPI00121FD7A8|nr:asparagine synthase (glutamine-hydrolyzing) [Sphingomonas sp.]THD35445.1 MAG: asparagine synthase (glutamine-hydrolyzing) [Sphingomonas sp.]
MCGIAGFHAHAAAARAVSRDTLIAMRDRMAARGPDGSGLWIAEDGRTGFGHRRLSIIDLSEGGHQPMATPDGRLTIVFNGEIYNYRALRDALTAAGVAFASDSDTEVMLHLYARDGAAMLGKLRGMFALAIWDARDRSLLLARDPLGIKPLYYSDTGGALTFASQVKALLVDPGVSREPSPAGLAGFHLTGSVPEPFTAWRAIKALPAGSWLRVDAAGVSAPVRYANVAQILADGRAADPASVDVAGALRDSVAHHLVADVEVGAFLSGGVDSAALIGLMRDCGQERIRACTLAFGEFEGQHQDETPGAAAVAKQYGVDHHIRRVGAAEFHGDMDAIFDAMDQPSIDGINTWFVSKAVREMGLKVALSGLGGDELLAGYSTFRTVPQMRRRFGPLGAIPGSGTMARLLLGLTGVTRRNPKAATVLDYAGSWAGAYLLRRAVLMPFELDTAMDPAMAREGLSELDPLGALERSITPDPGSDNGRVCALETGNYMRNQLLRDSDWAGMAHSLEIRVPLVDFTLLKTLAPRIATLQPGEGKRLLAAAPANPVPRAIVERSKTGFSVPVADWLAGNAVHTPDRRASRGWAKVATERSLQSVTALAR